MSDGEYKEGDDGFVSVRLRQNHAVKLDETTEIEEEDDDENIFFFRQLQLLLS